MTGPEFFLAECDVCKDMLLSTKEPHANASVMCGACKNTVDESMVYELYSSFQIVM
jgi:formylmethanofuran dehydrogenase subunit E